MHLSDADTERVRVLCERYGISRLELFGSRARGDAHAGSDIDLLCTLAAGASLGWEIEDLADELSEVLHAPVDLVSRRALHPRLRDAVLDEASPFYGAA